MSSPIVTPAKAGVHASTIAVVDKWIPAFAGMTQEGVGPGGCGYR